MIRRARYRGTWAVTIEPHGEWFILSWPRIMRRTPSLRHKLREQLSTFLPMPEPLEEIRCYFVWSSGWVQWR